jgi:hypothetical protein
MVSHQLQQAQHRHAVIAVREMGGIVAARPRVQPPGNIWGMALATSTARRWNVDMIPS